MRILQVIDIGYVAGGAEKSVLMLKNELKMRGHEVMVLSTTKGMDGRQQSFADFTTPHISGSFLVKLVKHSWNHSAYRDAKRVLKQFKPDIVHLHVIGEFSPSLLSALGDTPYVLTIHGPEEYVLKLLPWQLPPTDYVNGSYKISDLKLIGKARLLYFKTLQRPLFLRGFRAGLKKVISPSMYIQSMIQADFDDQKLVQVYNGIELPHFATLPTKRSLLYVGRLTSVKGVAYLLEALQLAKHELPDLELRIVGDGDQKDELVGLARDLGVGDRVKFLGWLSGEKVLAEYAAASVVVIPSIWPENLPTVCIEAMSVGRPVVGTNTGGIPELIEDNITGKIVPCYDSVALKDAIVDVLITPNKLGNMSLSANESARKFSITTFVNNIMEIYEKAIIS